MKDEKSLNNTVINWYPGHMAKTKREITEKLSLIDIVYEIIDSRMPKSSRIVDLDNLIKDKPRIIVFTKYDMCDEKVTDYFFNELSQKYVCLKVNLKENSSITKDIIRETEKLLLPINMKREAKGLTKRNYRALVIGVPNVGKSTFINRLAGRNIAQTGNMAGVTKNISWIKLNNNIELMDTPGILWPKMDDYTVSYNLASLTSIKEEILDKESVARYIMDFMIKNYPNLLKSKYGLENFDDLDSVFDTIGRKRGCLMKGNVVDYEKVYTIIINDIKEGKIGKVTFDR